jgi:hypothetical protein
MTLPDGEPIPFMGWVNDIEGESMNENQKKTTEEYRSNYDNIFKKKEKNGNEVLPIMPTDEGQGRIQTGSDIKQES